MTRLLERYRLAEDGAASIEYAIVAAFFALTIVASVTLIGDETAESFSNSAEGLQNAVP